MPILLKHVPEVLGASSLITWLYLTFLRGGFWRLGRRLPAPERVEKKEIVAVIPARDEALVIGSAVTSLLQQNYAGTLRVVVIDDNSCDATREVALRAAQNLGCSDRLQVLAASPPAPGWTGKLWALSEGLRQVGWAKADYLLLTDADIAHSPDNVTRLVGFAESRHADLVSLMVKLRCQSGAERSIVPAFLFFFFMLYPPAWISRSDRRTAAAAGGCMLVRPSALAAIGGIASIRGELIDDCALARRIKAEGGGIFLAATKRTRSLRAYERWMDVEQMIARSAFAQLNYSGMLLLGTAAAMTVVFLLPPLLLLSSRAAAICGLCSWVLMSLCFIPSLRLYEISPWRAPALPAIALFYLIATLHSAISYWRGEGGRWKGRIQGSMAGD